MGLRHAVLRSGLRALDRLAGGRSPGLRGAARYLIGLIDQGRFAEVDVLVAHGLRKLARRGVTRRGGRRSRRGGIAIDAVTQRLDAAGRIVPKRSWTYPGPDAAVLATVVIPCYNYGRYLMDAIGSARAQTVAAREIIVVDDGSTDPTTIALLDSLQDVPDLRIIRQANAGLPAARNAGIAVATGEFVCCLDADDMLDPTYLECAIALLLADRSVGFAYPFVRFFGDVEEVWETHEFDIDEALVANFTAVSAVFRRDDWTEAGGYSPVMRGGFEDWEFWIRLACLGRRGRVLRHPLFLHRRHGRTMTHEAKEQSEELRGRIRGLNPSAFTDAALRRRLQRLVPAAGDSRTALARLSGTIGRDSRPGLLVVVAWARWGGAEVLLLSLLRELAPRWRIVLVTTEEDEQAMSDEFRTVTPELFHLEGTVDPEDRLTFLEHLCRSRGVTHGLSSGSAWLLGVLPALRRLLPGLCWAHITHNEVADGVFRAALAAEEAVDRHVAVSRRVRDGLIGAGVAPPRVAHIENGIDTAPFAAAAGTRAEMRASLGVGPEEHLLLWAGRFAPEKRPVLFVEALRDLGGLPVRGVMVGAGPLDAEVDAAIAAVPGLRVTRLGQRGREEVARLLGAADLLVLTSAFEGLPLIVLEALAAGCPVVATDVGDIATVVRPGRSGALVDPGRPSDLAPAIRETLRTLNTAEARMRIRADFAATPHTLAAMAGAYASLLDGMGTAAAVGEARPAA